MLFLGEMSFLRKVGISTKKNIEVAILENHRHCRTQIVRIIHNTSISKHLNGNFVGYTRIFLELKSLLTL